MPTATLTVPPGAATPSPPARLSLPEFARLRRMLFDAAGIHLSDAKRELVAGRLGRRLQQVGLASYDEYHQLVSRDAGERQVAIDLLTTNETHFFREPRHFDRLVAEMLPSCAHGGTVRVWSAACSSGQEPYSIAMLMAEALGERPWEVVGSDISTRMLAQAANALYDMELAREIPADYLHRYCLKGTGSQQGRFQVAPALCARVRLRQVNLNETLPDLGLFDIVFVRNVMIYFSAETKREVVARLVQRLRPGGWLVVGHAESIDCRAHGLEMVTPSVYRRP